MSFDKQMVAQALRLVRDPVGGGELGLAGEGVEGGAGGRVRHIAACDGYVAIKLLAAGLEAGGQEGLSAAITQAVSQHAAAAGERLISMTVHYVDEQGRVQREFQSGEKPAAGGSAPGAGSASGAASPPKQSALTPGGGGAGEAGAGHRPIGGLQAAGNSSLPRVKHVVAVGAGKGGVGKSSIAVNMAVGLARRGLAVGLLDGDIYGPSIPTMLGLHEREQSVVGGRLQPFYVHGVKTITIGKLVDAERPLIWRGPMAHGAFKQLVEQTEWGGGGELDYLIIDLPPGTGDISLTMSQMLQLTGAVIVCTPQRVAQDDAIRAVRMFQQLKIEVLGVVENMSVFIGDDGKEYDIFGRGGAEKMASRLNVPFLGAVPITMALRENSDKGDPSANFKEPKLAQAFDAMIESLQRQVSLASMRQGQSKPTLNIS